MLYALWLTVFGLLFYAVNVALDFLLGKSSINDFVITFCAICAFCMLLAKKIDNKERGKNAY